MTFKLTDFDTVRRCWIQDFHWYTTGLNLNTYLTSKSDKTKSKAVKLAIFSCEKLVKAYEQKEELFKTFELDSEYYPIVLIRSLLPQLEENLLMEDYETAHMISGWICGDAEIWGDLLREFQENINYNFRGKPTID